MLTLLSPRQELFVLEYLKDQNASAAVERAGYTAKNMAAQGNALMSNPAIRDRVRLEMGNLLAELRASALELMRQRARAAFFRAERMFGRGWELLPLEALDEETRRAVEVSTVLRKSGPVVRLKQPDREKALRALEKAHEKLAQLNERFYAQAQREGRCPSLEEIERMDEAAAEPVEGGAALAEGQAAALASMQMRGGNIPEKDKVLSGCGRRAEGAPLHFRENHQVLSGCGPGGEAPALHFPEKTQVLSGCW